MQLKAAQDPILGPRFNGFIRNALTIIAVTHSIQIVGNNTNVVTIKQVLINYLIK